MLQCSTCDQTTQYVAQQCTANADTQCAAVSERMRLPGRKCPACPLAFLLQPLPFCGFLQCTEVDNCAAYKSNAACRKDFQKTCLTCDATFFLNQTSGECQPVSRCMHRLICACMHAHMSSPPLGLRLHEHCSLAAKPRTCTCPADCLLQCYTLGSNFHVDANGNCVAVSRALLLPAVAAAPLSSLSSFIFRCCEDY